MIGVGLTLLVTLGWVGYGLVAFRQLLMPRANDEDRSWDPVAVLGLAGLLGLGSLGFLTFFIGLIPGGFRMMPVVVGASLPGIWFVARRGWARDAEPVESAWKVALIAGVGLSTLFALLGALAPSDAGDWDSISHHLAVAKQWIQAGQMFTLTSLHQSNFPLTINGLYVWGLQYGDQSGAKAFSVAIFLLGTLAIFGLARQTYGALAGVIAALAFATIPVVVWESGTAYIDVGHGLYAGLGLFFVARYLRDSAREDLVLAGILLGFAVGTKYTGLQTLAISGLVLLVGGFLRQRAATAIKPALLVGILAVAIASPWYIRTAVTMGNPVYPFFFEKLGGKMWDQRRADIYRNEQQTFGVGRTEKGRDATAVGHAVLGLGYQPGRFINPGQEQGLGTPLGSVGIVLLLSLFGWAFAGRKTVLERSILAGAAFSLFLWFFLSQQSRYIVSIAPPLAILFGGLAMQVSSSWGRGLRAAVGVQAVVTFGLLWLLRIEPILPVATGQESREDYLTRTTPIYAAAQRLNEVAKGGKVALYDEVFGFYLDVPYVWANPGHGTFIPYDTLNTADEYVAKMKELGFTHIYTSLWPVVKDRAYAQRWVGAMGLNGTLVPLPPDERAAILASWERKWEVLLLDAVAAGKLELVEGFKNGIVFRIP